MPKRARKPSGAGPTAVVDVNDRPQQSVPFIPEPPKGDKSPDRSRTRGQQPPRELSRPNNPRRVRRRLKPGGLFRLIRRFRIGVALALALAAAAAALLAGERSDVEMATAVRVTTDVVAGEVLNAAVLEQEEVHAVAVPDHYSADLGDVIGQTAAVALPAGSVVHPTQLVGPGLLTGHEPGTVAVPVRPADTAIIGLLSPGQRVDVTVSTDAPESQGGSRRIAEAVPVIWIPQDESENWLGATSESKNVVIVAVDAATAGEIAEATSSGRVHVSLVSATE